MHSLPINLFIEFIWCGVVAVEHTRYLDTPILAAAFYQLFAEAAAFHWQVVETSDVDCGLSAIFSGKMCAWASIISYFSINFLIHFLVLLSGVPLNLYNY